MNNIFFLIINEKLSEGLLQSQLIEPVRQHLASTKPTFVYICKFSERYYRHDTINIINLPIAIPYKIFLFNALFLLTPLVALFYACLLFFYIPRNATLVARSYFPALVSLILSKFKKINYIFDSRSLFIHENVSKGSLKNNGFNHRMWQFFEKSIIQHATKTIAVSNKQQSYYTMLNRAANVIVIPCYSNQQVVYSATQLRTTRNRLGFKDEDVVICYFGSLDKGWNNIDIYSSFFQISIQKGYKILIISQNYSQIKTDVRFINSSITLLDPECGMNSDECMQCCDYGVIIMDKHLDWETRLSVKFVEYLTAGLGVIVGEYVGEAVRYANEYFKEVSVVYKNSQDIDNLQKISREITCRSKKAAWELFGNGNIKKAIY